ncbi:outer membrane transport energization protein ExbD [Panacagrimonas perspica]|uniref:Outer membrane transport energization protein ExbD n=2 Tax=Panacagrimonas perspica TaxID=381431 RepID=A0A4R7PC15_9GAMM|nr:outer membrane transport energization protein ExbD [Panacagrimonas perspica]THD03363.1 hypothetical protein B1810_11660 [Panacagrimonas perspica]
MLPLINVVFLLMVFFMLVGSLSVRDVLEIEPARARQLAPADAGSGTLVIAADGRLGWGRRIFALDQLKAQAAAWQARHAGQTLEVKADAALEARAVVDILGVLRDAGIVQVKLLAANVR